MSKKTRRKQKQSPPAKNNRRVETMLLAVIAFLLLALGTTAWRFSDNVKGQSANLEQEIRSVGSTINELATEFVTVKQRLQSIEVTLNDDADNDDTDEPDTPLANESRHGFDDTHPESENEEPLHPSEWPLEWLK